MDVAARRIRQREILPVALAVPDEQALRVKHGFELMADELRDARGRFELLHVVDQLDQDALPVVAFAEEPPIEPSRQLRPETQADDRRADQIEVQRIGPQQLPDRLVAVREHAVGQAGHRQRQQEAQRVLRQQILQAAPDHERDVEDVVLDDGVAETDRNQHGREVHQRIPSTEVDRRPGNPHDQGDDLEREKRQQSEDRSPEHPLQPAAIVLPLHRAVVACHHGNDGQAAERPHQPRRPLQPPVDRQQGVANGHDTVGGDDVRHGIGE